MNRYTKKFIYSGVRKKKLTMDSCFSVHASSTNNMCYSIKNLGTAVQERIKRSLDFEDEEMLDIRQVRSYFPENWIFDEKVVG